MLSLAEAHAVEKARRFCPQRQRPGDYDRLKLLADAIVADLELCGIRCCRQLPALRHRTQVSWVSSGDVAEKLTVGMAAGPITRSATGSALALALGPTMACTPLTSTRRRAAATAFSGSDVASLIATVTGEPNTPPP